MEKEDGEKWYNFWFWTVWLTLVVTACWFEPFW
jgi:hypothetical protein